MTATILKKRILCGVLALLLFFAGCAPLPEADSTASAPTQTAGTTASTDSATQPTDAATTAPTEDPAETTAPAVTDRNSSFAVHFIDVGQADAALVLCDGKAMLIDGGNAEDSNLLYTYLKKQNVNHLDYVIGTHAHEDHIGGLAGALNYASAATAYCPVTAYDSKAFDNFVKALAKHDVTITVPKVGTSFKLGSADCSILAVNTETDEPNNTSIVLRVVYGSTAFLFTGDAETPVEDFLLDNGATLGSTVLKVGHHGSDSSTGYRWLRQVDPKYAVISVGKGNTYGHPTETVLSRLRDAEITTFRTDLQGDILCTSDGQSVTFSVARNANADVFSGLAGNSTQQTEPVETEPNQTEPPETQPVQTEPPETQPKPTEPAPTEPKDTGTDYVANTNSKKFHYPSCSSAKQIKASNRWNFHGTRDELIRQGYEPCKRCYP